MLIERVRKTGLEAVGIDLESARKVRSVSSWRNCYSAIGGHRKDSRSKCADIEIVEDEIYLRFFRQGSVNAEIHVVCIVKSASCTGVGVAIRASGIRNRVHHEVCEADWINLAGGQY